MCLEVKDKDFKPNESKGKELGRVKQETLQLGQKTKYSSHVGRM